MAGRAMQCQLPKNQSHVLISPPPTSPTASRLEHEGSTLGLLVTTVSQCQNPYANSVRESWLGGTAEPSSKGPELHTEEGWCGPEKALHPARDHADLDHLKAVRVNS
jgi:hypothetical protein